MAVQEGHQEETTCLDCTESWLSNQTCSTGWDAHVEASCIQLGVFCLQLCLGAYLQSIEAFYLQLELLCLQLFRSLGTAPISGKTLSEWKGHSRSSRRVPRYSRSSSRNWKFHSRNMKFHSRNGLSRLDQYETHNSRSNSRSDSRNCRQPNRKIFICPCILGAFFSRIGVVPAHQNYCFLLTIKVFLVTVWSASSSLGVSKISDWETPLKTMSVGKGQDQEVLHRVPFMVRKRLILFSPRSCRSSSVFFFFLIFCCGKFGGNFAGFFRTRRIGANPEKSDLVNFRGPD